MLYYLNRKIQELNARVEEFVKVSKQELKNF